MGINGNIGKYYEINGNPWNPRKPTDYAEINGFHRNPLIKRKSMESVEIKWLHGSQWNP